MVEGVDAVWAVGDEFIKELHAEKERIVVRPKLAGVAIFRKSRRVTGSIVIGKTFLIWFYQGISMMKSPWFPKSRSGAGIRGALIFPWSSFPSCPTEYTNVSLTR